MVGCRAKSSATAATPRRYSRLRRYALRRRLAPPDQAVYIVALLARVVLVLLEGGLFGRAHITGSAVPVADSDRRQHDDRNPSEQRQDEESGGCLR